MCARAKSMEAEGEEEANPNKQEQEQEPPRMRDELLNSIMPLFDFARAYSWVLGPEEKSAGAERARDCEAERASTPTPSTDTGLRNSAPIVLGHVHPDASEPLLPLPAEARVRSRSDGATATVSSQSRSQLLNNDVRGSFLGDDDSHFGVSGLRNTNYSLLGLAGDLLGVPASTLKRCARAARNALSSTPKSPGLQASNPLDAAMEVWRRMANPLGPSLHTHAANLGAAERAEHSNANQFQHAHTHAQGHAQGHAHAHAQHHAHLPAAAAEMRGKCGAARERAAATTGDRLHLTLTETSTASSTTTARTLHTRQVDLVRGPARDVEPARGAAAIVGTPRGLVQVGAAAAGTAAPAPSSLFPCHCSLFRFQAISPDGSDSPNDSPLPATVSPPLLSAAIREPLLPRAPRDNGHHGFGFVHSVTSLFKPPTPSQPPPLPWLTDEVSESYSFW
eukprot:m.89066 g.89066  ORF g.89066 m.89066 type:complete len:450 (+) comp13641_c2_seq1:2581-3930(+)